MNITSKAINVSNSYNYLQQQELQTPSSFSGHVEVGAITDQWGAISHVTLGSIEPQGTKKNTGLCLIF